MKVKFFLIFLNVLFLFICGCATPPKALVEKDILAKRFLKNDKSASIYIYRSQIVASMIGIATSVNGKKIGVTGPKTYFKLELNEGRYRIASLYDSNICDIDIDVVNGRNYYIWQELKFSLTNTCSMTIVNENDAMREIKELDLLEN